MYVWGTLIMGFLLFWIWRTAVSLAVQEVERYRLTYPREVKGLQEQVTKNPMVPLTEL